MVTTPRHVLRERILKVLLDSQGKALTRKQVLDRLRSKYEAAWTEEDVASPASRPFEAKWENNASFERADMVREGLLEEGGDGHWVLTSRGMQHAHEHAKQLTLIDDIVIDNRGYADLRAGQMMLGTEDADSAIHSDFNNPSPVAQLEQIDEVPFEVVAAAVPLESSNTFDYHVNGNEPTVAIKQEAWLVERFVTALEGRGHQVGRFRIQPPGEMVALYTDVFDVTENRLYEAKASAARAAVRMAIGQLLDYSRHIHPAPRLAVLLPTRPTSDLLNLLTSCEIDCVYEAGEGSFTGVRSQ